MKELAQFSKIFNEAPAFEQSQVVEKVYQKISYINPLASECEHINRIQVRKCPRCGNTHIILNGKRKQNVPYCHTDCL